MASKKKRNRPRPPSGPRPATKAGSLPAAKGASSGAAKGASSGTAKGASSPGAKEASTSAKAVPKPRERTGPTRAERLAAAEAARRRKATRNRLLVLAALLAVVTVITVTVINARRSNDRVVEQLEASGACTYDSRADRDSGAGRNHVSGSLTYEVDPPAGGNHNPAAAAPGVFTEQTKPDDGQIVHALEHGYVAIWYRPDVDAAEVERLRELAGRYDRDVLLVPRATMERPVAATAWHRRLLCSAPDVDALDRFVTSYRNEGPEKVPH